MDVPTPKLADYDLRHGHLLLWGDADPCDVMRPFRADEIPAFEGTWLLRNRAIGLVLARLYLDLTGALRPEHVENFYIELNKSALAMGDALWILSGRYDVSYATRKAGFKDLARLGYPAFDALSRLYDQAAEYKLRPVEGQYPGQSPQSLWLTLAQAHVDFFCWHESRRLGQSIASPAQWQAWADGQTHDGSGNALRRWADRHLGASGQCPALMAPLRQDRLGSVACALGLLAARGERTREGWQALARWRGADCPGDPAAAWRHLARGLLSALHPGGEVGRFLASTQDSP